MPDPTAPIVTLMRTLACTTLVCSLLLACSGDGNMATTQASKTADPTADSNSSSDPSNVTASNPTSSDGTQTSGTTQAPGTTDAAEGSTTAPTTAGPDTDAMSTGSSSTGTTGGDTNLMKKYGAPCTTDDDCIKLLGPGGLCLTDILGVYNLPGGYCSTDCDFPDQQQTYIPMAPDCKLGADCIGLMGFFEGCTFPCTDSSQCQRDGYECRQMPEISNPADPTYCLMTEDNKI
jgi:hypothetical protein